LTSIDPKSQSEVQAVVHAEKDASCCPVPHLLPGAKAQTALVRHIFGNPFHPYLAPPSWPAAVVSLAEAVYNGADGAFALHDALLDAGQPDLAEHFQAEQWHPKGCWVVDLLLGKS